jgi:hypothetical protein
MVARLSETTRKEKATARVITARKSTRMRTHRQAREGKKMEENRLRNKKGDKCLRRRKDLAKECEKRKQKQRQRGKSKHSWTVLAVMDHGRDVPSRYGSLRFAIAMI